jgi:carboxypeptidase Taq
LPTFAPALQELISLRRQQASQLAAAEPVARSPWEILAQPFEPDISKARLDDLFTPLKTELPALLEQVAATSTAQPAAIDLPEALQEQLGSRAARQLGLRPQRCQRARSAHPFSCTVGPQDFRITTRVVPGQPLSAFLATAHEWGHSLYEQGLPRSDDHYFPWPLGEATSMGVHEARSSVLGVPRGPQPRLRRALAAPLLRRPGQRSLGRRLRLLACPQPAQAWPDPRGGR